MKYKLKKIHFVGIGGVGMSGIAEIMHNLGFTISGSDLTHSENVDRLFNLGIKVFNSHKSTNIKNADVVVKSTAINENNVEIKEALNNNIPVIPRAAMLGELLRFKQGIIVAGTHGKTTTTSLIASIMAEAFLDPTFVIGGKLESVGTNSKLGKGDFMVVEADESDGSFLFLKPILAVITNIDSDHMSTYDYNIKNLKQAFLDVLRNIPFYGKAFICVDDQNSKSLIKYLNIPYLTYGFSQSANFRGTKVKIKNKKMFFKVIKKNEKGIKSEMDVVLNMPGKHNVLNSLAAIGLCTEIGIKNKFILSALRKFSGVRRRFQIYENITIKENKKFSIVDDYGHHPEEIKSTIEAVRLSFPKRRVLLVFQPHRYSRTKDCFNEFVKILSTVDFLVLTEVFSAGERKINSADGLSLANAIKRKKKNNLLFIKNIKDLSFSVLSLIEDNDVLVIMGAGSISNIVKEILYLKK